MKSIWQRLARWLAKATGWTLVDNRPPTQKYIIVGAPHTTNWDLYTALLILLGLGIRPRWIGKASLFKGPLKPLMRWLGGIPVRRDIRQNFVEQIVQRYKESDELVIVIAPEGTRSYTDYWKSGFYYIALGAQIPIVMGFVDYPTKTCGLGGYFTPSGDLEADMKILADFYADKRGRYPEKQGPVRIRPRGKKANEEKQAG